MNTVGKPERTTQNRVISLFINELNYDYLGNWEYRDGNSNIEEKYLSKYLSKQNYTTEQINSALYKLRTKANNPNRSLYDNNKAVYQLLRYGIQTKTSASENTESLQLINWQNPEANSFGIAEEVTIQGSNTKRPDIVLYINGIAIAILELKSSRKDIGEGIRQSINNQKPEFIQTFFSTIQLILAGNDTEGLRYGTIGTPEKFFLKWKEDETENTRYKLDKYLLKLCNPDRLLELLYDFILFDGGIKKVPRVNQYFGIKAAQDFVQRHESGIIWHTQGSGKSITMVLLTKWILENNPNARIVVVTDREELDKQIFDIFNDAGESIYRTRNGRDLMTQLGKATPRLLCTLVHKYGQRDIKNFDQFIKDLEAQPSHSVGDLFVFVDECHRTQSGKLNRTMKAIMGNATFIGFTGTPLLKRDKATTLEVFGRYIHTYKYNEGVEDGIVLDLIYEARDIDQKLGSEDKVDAWFDAKTKGLNDWQKATLREKWGTMQKVLSSRSRMDRVVSDIVFDFGVKPRLNNDRGNAILVTSSIYEACKYFELFQKTVFRGKCAVISSYEPHTKHITTEDTGANTETDKEFIYNTYTEILKQIQARPKHTKAETYSEESKDQFKTNPAQMKLLIVVDKLLTGFDAPSCTYLYIEKSMQDHGLFQAICRTNRLDGDDKDFGYIVDYKDLFNKVEDAIAVYTSELDPGESDLEDPAILLKNRLTLGKDRLDTALETLHYLCEPVPSPQEELDYIHYFCGNIELPEDLKQNEPKRTALYKGIASLIRAYANISDDLESAGYSPSEIANIQQDVDHYLKLREVIRKSSGETLDLKPYEADMRHLIDTYIEANEPRKISEFENTPLLKLITTLGIDTAISEQLSCLKGNQTAIAETIENNVRSTISTQSLTDPAYYQKMSALLEEIIKTRKEKAIAYEDYLQKIAQLAQQVSEGDIANIPSQLKTPGQIALFNNLNTNAAQAAEKPEKYGSENPDNYLDLVLKIDQTVKTIRPDNWRGNPTKAQQIKAGLYGVLQDIDEVERIFTIIEQQSEY